MQIMATHEREGRGLDLHPTPPVCTQISEGHRAQLSPACGGFVHGQCQLLASFIIKVQSIKSEGGGEGADGDRGQNVGC